MGASLTDVLIWAGIEARIVQGLDSVLVVSGLATDASSSNSQSLQGMYDSLYPAYNRELRLNANAYDTWFYVPEFNDRAFDGNARQFNQFD
jgi:hypothetical protein